MKEFDYGKISISRRFECESTKIEKVIRIALVKERKGFTHESFWEIQVLYVDESGVRQCDLFCLDEYQVKVLYKGDMGIEI